MSADQDLAHEGEPVPGHPVAALVIRAGNGDELRWDALAERYAPLIWSLCRRYRLGGAGAAEAGQNVWLQLVNQPGKIRDPAALPGWLATTTRRECTRVLSRAHAPHAALQAPDADNIPDDQASTPGHVLAAERHAALREASAHLPPCRQQLIALLTNDPPVPYAQISARLGIPAGSIGPNRGWTAPDR